MKQQFDPYVRANETRCGDCNLMLTDSFGRLRNAYFESGVRCEECYTKWKNQETVEKQ